MSVTSIPVPLPPGERLDSIDALRGIAALYVLVHHLAFIPQPNLTVPRWAATYVLTGGAGVTLFFIVSAFCLCLSMRTHQSEPSPVTRFYLRRIFRVVPLFYVWLVLSWLRDWMVYGVLHPWWEVLLDASFVFNFVPGKNEGYVWAGWTLGVEMAFYLVFPLIFRYAGTLVKSLLFFTLSLGLALAFSELAVYLPFPEAVRASFVQFSFFRHLPVFALGMVTFFLYERFVRGRSRSRWGGILLVGAALFAYDSVLRGRVSLHTGPVYSQGLIYGLVMFGLTFALVGLIYGMLMLGLSFAPVGLIVNRMTRFFGKISYSVYLNHPTFVFLLIPVYRSIYSLHIRPTFQYGACLLLTLCLLTTFSYYTHRYIESPGIRLGSRMIKLLGR